MTRNRPRARSADESNKNLLCRDTRSSEENWVSDIYLPLSLSLS